MPDLHHCPKCGGAGMPRWALNRKEVEAYVCVACGILFAAAKPHTATESVPEPKAGVRGPRRDKAPQKPAKRRPQNALPGLKIEKPDDDMWKALQEPDDKGSELEIELLCRLRMIGCPPERREFCFNPSRKWRADFAWPSIRLLVEVQGGSRQYGRHNRHAGQKADYEKFRAASVAGFVILLYVSDDVHTMAAEEITSVVAMLSKSCAVMAREEGER